MLPYIQPDVAYIRQDVMSNIRPDVPKIRPDFKLKKGWAKQPACVPSNPAGCDSCPAGYHLYPAGPESFKYFPKTRDMPSIFNTFLLQVLKALLKPYTPHYKKWSVGSFGALPPNLCNP